MFHKLLLLLCTVVSINAVAQQSNTTSSKTTEKQDDHQIDYKQPGAPLPRFKLLIYHDTGKNKAAGIKKDSVAAAAKHLPKKKSKQKDKHDVDKPKLILTDKDLDIGANFLIMIFNPTCSHCEEETIMLEKNFALFKRSKLVLMAAYTMWPYISDFAGLMHLNEYPDITIGIDSSGFIDNAFRYQALPQINIYDHKQKLLKIYTGEVSIDSLKQYIE